MSSNHKANNQDSNYDSELEEDVTTPIRKAEKEAIYVADTYYSTDPEMDRRIAQRKERVITQKVKIEDVCSVELFVTIYKIMRNPNQRVPVLATVQGIDPAKWMKDCVELTQVLRGETTCQHNGKEFFFTKTNTNFSSCGIFIMNTSFMDKFNSQHTQQPMWVFSAVETSTSLDPIIGCTPTKSMINIVKILTELLDEKIFNTLNSHKPRVQISVKQSEVTICGDQEEKMFEAIKEQKDVEWREYQERKRIRMALEQEKRDAAKNTPKKAKLYR